MKKIDPQYIVTNAAQPFKKGTWVHLQQAYQEAIDSIARNLLDTGYDPTKIYFLYGCVNTGSGLSYVISAGAIFFNGEVYLVDAATFTAASGEVAVGTITESFYAAASADPVTFTDGTAHNVHSILKMVFAAGTTGTGDADYGAGVRNYEKIAATLAGGWTNIIVANTEGAFYRKDYRTNTLSIGGFVAGPTTGTIFTLPVGYRPVHQKIIFSFNRQSSGQGSLGFIHIRPDGTVGYTPDETLGTAPTAAEIKLDGITINLD